MFINILMKISENFLNDFQVIVFFVKTRERFTLGLLNLSKNKLK